MGARKMVMTWICAAVVAISGCNDFGSEYGLPVDTHRQITIAQGIWGDVWFWEGDFRPGSASGTIRPVERDILVYEATQWDSVVTVGGGFYRAILTKLVAQTRSNRSGFYQVALPPG